MAYDECREFPPKPESGRKHALSLSVWTDGRECISTIPNPRSSDEGGPVWTLTYGGRLSEVHCAEIASIIESFYYLLSPAYTAADAMKRLRELRAAYRDACLDATPNPTGGEA